MHRKILYEYLMPKNGNNPGENAKFLQFKDLRICIVQLQNIKALNPRINEIKTTVANWSFRPNVGLDKDGNIQKLRSTKNHRWTNEQYEFFSRFSVAIEKEKNYTML